MEVKLPLQVKKLNPNAYLPSKGSERAAGYDLCSVEETVVPANGKALVKTGLAIAIPSGNYGRVAPRSGLAVKKFIDTGAGVIDEDYRGEVCVVLFNHSAEDFKIVPGDRIAQLIIEKISDTGIVEVDQLDDTNRGAGGFGSTGVSVGDVKQPTEQNTTEFNLKRNTPLGGFFSKDALSLDKVNLEDEVDWKEWAVLVLHSLCEGKIIKQEERKQWLKLVFAGDKKVCDVLREYLQNESIDRLREAYGGMNIQAQC